MLVKQTLFLHMSLNVPYTASQMRGILHCIELLKAVQYTYVYTMTFIHTCIHTYMHSYMHTYMHAYMQTYIRTYIHTYMHAYMQTYIRTYMHTFMHTYLCVCAREGVYMYGLVVYISHTAARGASHTT